MFLNIIFIIIIIYILYLIYYLRETTLDKKKELQLDILKDGIMKIKHKQDILEKLPKGYQFLKYKYSIKGCTLSTFHRDVTSSQYIFKTKHPIYTYIKYGNKGPHLSFCPNSHLTTPFVFSRPKTILGEKGDSYIFNCDMVHAGAINDYGKNRYAEQYKIAHKDDIPRLKHLLYINKLKNGKCDISKWNNLIQRHTSLIFAYPINHLLTPLLQKRHKSKIVRQLIRLTGIRFYNQ